jgi:hypothetical protein
MTGPKPEITSVESYSQGWDEEWYPAGPRGFAKRARAAGWDVRIGFSRGSIPGARADTWVVRDAIGVWLNGYGRRAVVVWTRNPEAEFSARKLEAGTIKPGEIPSGMRWSSTGGLIMIGKYRAFPYANLTDMEEWVALRGAVLPAWYEAIRSWVLAHEEHAARKAKAKAEAEARAKEKAAMAR